MKKCLIIDDASIIRSVLSEIIKRYFPQFQIIREAKNGEEALKILEKEKFDFIFLDINMPRLNGIKTLQAINLLHGNPLPQITILSADRSEVKKNHLIQLGANHLIEKPFTPEDIVNLIQKNINKGEHHESI